MAEPHLVTVEFEKDEYGEIGLNFSFRVFVSFVFVCWFYYLHGNVGGVDPLMPFSWI